MPTLSHRHLSLGTVIYIIGVAAIVGALIYYVAFQARYLIAGPTITLRDNYPVDQASSTVVIEGTARNITSLSLDGRPIFTDDDGNFKELLVLPEGYTIMTLQAKDRYGRETTLTHPFVRNE